MNSLYPAGAKGGSPVSFFPATVDFSLGARYAARLRTPAAAGRIVAEELPMKFSIRDLLLVTVIAALAVAWWVDRSVLAKKIEQLTRPTPVRLRWIPQTPFSTANKVPEQVDRGMLLDSVDRTP